MTNQLPLSRLSAGMNEAFRVLSDDEGGEEDERDVRARLFWDEEFAVVAPPKRLASDLERLTRPIPEGDPKFQSAEQFEVSLELNQTLSSLSLSFSSPSSGGGGGGGGESPLSKGDKTTTPASGSGNSSGSFTPFSPNERAAIGPLTVYSDSSPEQQQQGEARPLPRRPLVPQSPTEVLLRFARRTREERDGDNDEDEVSIIQTPLGPRKLVSGRPGIVLVDSSNKTLALLRGSEVRTFALSSKGATPVMGGDIPQVEHTRDGYTVTFSSMIVRDEKEATPLPRQRGGGGPVTVGTTVGRSLMPFHVWTDPQERAVQPVPLGAFRVKTAYFVGTYKGDLVGKRECGMMYSSTEAPLTVIQSNHPDFSQQKSHFVIAFCVDRNRQTLFQVAIHKRLWAHSWVRGKEDVYFPRVPVLTSGGGSVHTDVGIRIWATVLADKKGSRDPVTKRALHATVIVRRIAFELPLSVSQFIVAPRSARKGNIFADDDDDE